MKKTSISKQDELLIVQYYKTHTARSTAKYFHIRPSRLNKILETYGIEKHPVVKTPRTDELKDKIIELYPTATDCELCKALHITKKTLAVLLKELNIAQHTETENRKIAQAKIHSIDQTLKQQVISYYLTPHTETDTALYFNISRSLVSKIIAEVDLKRSHKEVYKVQDIQEKIKTTCLKKYGVENYTQTKDFHTKVITHYKFETETFDSSWELAYWIYAKDHSLQIEHEPVRLTYSTNNKNYYYFPDFRLNNQLVEIKGDHMCHNKKIKDLWGNIGSKKLQAKIKCMQENNIKILNYEDIKFALDYVRNNYGKNYLKQFKKTKENIIDINSTRDRTEPTNNSEEENS